jgi:hypothetical protein
MQRLRIARVAILSLALTAGFGAAGFNCAAAQPAQFTPAQAEALDAYNNAVTQFQSVLSERRAQIDAKQPLPNLPGQAIYLARLNVMSTYKDLTDAIPSRIGRPNKFGVPPAYFDAAIEPLIDDYLHLFDIMQAPPADAQNSETPFADVIWLGTDIARGKGSMPPPNRPRAASASACSLPRPMASRISAMRAPTPTKAAFRPASPKIATARGNGRPSRTRSPRLTPY